MERRTKLWASIAARTAGVPRILRRCIAIATGASCVCACTERHITTSSAFDDLFPSGTQTGVFKAGNVAGLDFASGTDSGVTDANGQFTCATGQTIAFSIGNVDLGDAECASIVHPAALTASGLLTDPAALNITRFLLLLDDDQLPDNGIAISAPLRTLSGSWPAIDFAASDFEGQLAPVVSDLVAVRNGATVSVPSSAEAFAYLDASLSCAYTGLFVNTFASGPFLAPTDVAVIVQRDPASGTDVFKARVRRNHPQSQLFLEADGTVELATLPLLLAGSSNSTGSVAGEYRNPDVVNGGWSNGVAQQPIDRTGLFEAVRIGRASGQYRFVGAYTRPADVTTSVTVLVGFVALTLDGDTLNGEGFDLPGGYSFAISGRRLAGTDAVELTPAIAGATSTVTLVTDTSGAPIGLEGEWPGLADGSIKAAGCYLN